MITILGTKESDVDIHLGEKSTYHFNNFNSWNNCQFILSPPLIFILTRLKILKSVLTCFYEEINSGNILLVLSKPLDH